MAATPRLNDQISFLGTGDCGPVHGPKDGFPIARYTELVRPTLDALWRLESLPDAAEIPRLFVLT